MQSGCTVDLCGCESYRTELIPLCKRACPTTPIGMEDPDGPFLSQPHEASPPHSFPSNRFARLLVNLDAVILIFGNNSIRR